MRLNCANFRERIRHDTLKEAIVRVMARCGPGDSWKRNDKPELASVIIELSNLLGNPFTTDEAIALAKRIGIGGSAREKRVHDGAPFAPSSVVSAGVCIVCGSSLVMDFSRGHPDNMKVHCNDCGSEVTKWMHDRRQAVANKGPLRNTAE
jgi:hypothetical protein